MEEIEKLIRKTIGIAIEIHKQIGPGYAEKIWFNTHKVLVERLYFAFNTV